ncbi:hypothetical protein [Candidatus Nanoperiomorbus periodonticus]|uniref:hypothetical protein n=1 Tax=Candidatus Nanoperiomorbus periodonticus TaxID=2171989 RepID=UPI00101E02D9|nr:hypothetical protein [Candidatus Nanoperiomorbus periodonticus]RYC75903.1 hypothetical protein G52EAM_00148 [Candidatus Nanoperiomorbus periodonticus]
MSNKNHPGNSYQSINILDLSVDDWFTPFSELVKRQSTNQAKDQEVADSPKPEQPNQEQQPEAESVQETTATARQTKERVVAEVALTGQSAGEKESVGSSQTGQDEPRAEVTKLQDTGPKESPAERLANDPAWQKQGHQASDKVWEKTLELQGFEKLDKCSYVKCVPIGSMSEQALDRERTKAINYANSASTMVNQLYSNPGWSPCELLDKEVLQRYTEESPDNARLVEALDAVYNLFNTTYHNNWTENMTISNDVAKVVCDSLDYNHNKFEVSVFCRNNHGLVGVAALYHLRKELRDDEPIKKILRIADSGSAAEVREIFNDTDKSDDVADYERKLGLIDRMVERVDQYLDGAWSGWNCFTMHLDDGESNMLYEWLSVRSTEWFVAGLSEDELRQRIEECTDSDEIYSYIKQWDGKNLYETADWVHDTDIRARERRKAESSRTA